MEEQPDERPEEQQSNDFLQYLEDFISEQLRHGEDGAGLGSEHPDPVDKALSAVEWRIGVEAEATGPQSLAAIIPGVVGRLIIAQGNRSQLERARQDLIDKKKEEARGVPVDHDQIKAANERVVKLEKEARKSKEEPE